MTRKDAFEAVASDSNDTGFYHLDYFHYLIDYLSEGSAVMSPLL